MCGDPFYTKITRGLVASAHAHGRQAHWEFVVQRGDLPRLCKRAWLRSAVGRGRPER